MYAYPLRAMSKNGQYLIPFTLEDGPCPIDGDHFVLTAREGSPILIYDSIARGMDVEGLYEGDIIVVDGVEYALYYDRGMIAVNLENEILNFENIGKFQHVGNIYNREEFTKIKRTRQRYKHDGLIFTIKELYGKLDSKLLLNKEDGLLIDPKNIQQYSYMKEDRGRGVGLYFGDKGLHLLNGACILPESDTDSNTRGEKLG